MWYVVIINNWLGKCEIWGLWGVLGSAWWLTQWGQEQLPTAVTAALNFPLSSDRWSVLVSACCCTSVLGHSWFHPSLPTRLPTGGAHPPAQEHPVSLAITEFHCQLGSGQWPVCHYMVTGPGGGSQVWNYWPTSSNPCCCCFNSGWITEFHQVGSVFKERSVTHRIIMGQYL